MCVTEVLNLEVNCINTAHFNNRSKLTMSHKFQGGYQTLYYRICFISFWVSYGQKD